MNRVECKRWEDFRSFVDHDRQIMPVYWRGQKDPSWPLASGFERQILQMNGGTEPGATQVYPYDSRFERDGKPRWGKGFYQGLRDRYLQVFRQASAGLRGANPAQLDNDQWWALGRHFGLVTPLLDWTDSPYIAAFFALSELLSEMKRPGGGLDYSGRCVALYRLFHNEKLEGDNLRVIRPTVDELGRMHGQRGLFTLLDSERFFELQGFLDHTGRGDLLTQITISDQALIGGLRDTKAHGIDYRLLFPDLHGAAQHANTLWDFF